MKLLRTLVLRFAGLFQRRRRDRELATELESHLQMHIDENVERGMNPAEARRQALIKLGGVEQTKLDYRARRGLPIFETLAQDMRYGFRMLSKSPGFTSIAILTLALGIGANSTIFSAVYGIVLKPLPYANPSQLVNIVTQKMSSGMWLQSLVSAAAAKDIGTQCTAFESLIAYGDGENFTLTGQGSPEKISGARVPGNFFTFFGVRPLLGRPILPSDTTAGADGVVVLSYATWKKLFDGDPGRIGKKITLSGKQYIVTGVMPSGFTARFDFEESQGGVWVAQNASASAGRDNRDEAVLARLKPGITVKEASAQLKTLAARLGATYPKTDAGWDLVVSGVKNFQVGYLQEPLLLLLGAVGFVLLIACVNVSSLLLARGWARQKEVAVREALGATRPRIIRQFLTESIMLSLTGGALGLLLAAWGAALLRAIAPPDTPRINEVHLDVSVFWFTLGVSVLAGILFGLAPAWQVSGHGIGTVLKGSASGLSGGLSRRRPKKLLGALVVIEVALAVILVAGATLVARSFQKLTAIDLGFRTDHIMTMTVNFSKAVCDIESEDKTTQCNLAASEILRRVKSIPGVENATEVSVIPTNGSNIAMDLSIEGKPERLGFSAGAPIWYRSITSEYFSTLGIRLLRGRNISVPIRMRRSSSPWSTRLLRRNICQTSRWGCASARA